MDWLLEIHITSAMLSLSGFVARGVWMIRGSSKLRASMTRILPHVIDTVLLLSGIWLVFRLRLSPIQHVWLGSKLIAVMIYIGLGSVALHYGRTRAIRITAWVAALVVFAYIVGVALTRQPVLFTAT